MSRPVLSWYVHYFTKLLKSLPGYVLPICFEIAAAMQQHLYLVHHNNCTLPWSELWLCKNKKDWSIFYNIISCRLDFQPFCEPAFTAPHHGWITGLPIVFWPQPRAGFLRAGFLVIGQFCRSSIQHGGCQWWWLSFCSQGKQKLEISIGTWSGRAPWNCSVSHSESTQIMFRIKNVRRNTCNLINHEHRKNLNGKATQNNGLKRLFHKVRTYHRLCTLHPVLSHRRETFTRYGVRTRKFQPGVFLR